MVLVMIVVTMGRDGIVGYIVYFILGGVYVGIVGVLRGFGVFLELLCLGRVWENLEEVRNRLLLGSTVHQTQSAYNY